jgi:hypothetical protein
MTARIGATLLLLVATFTVSAQAPPVRVRGEIQALEGQTLVVATESDGIVRLTLTDMTGINGLEERRIADIANNAFIGTTAIKDKDGRWQATEVHIFPESMRGAGEGHYAWDLPESSMTNGAVTGAVAKGRGRTLQVRHAGGTVDVDVTRRTDIVALTIGSRALLVPGTKVFALAAPQQGGAATAVALVVETDGVEPPM